MIKIVACAFGIVSFQGGKLTDMKGDKYEYHSTVILIFELSITLLVLTANQVAHRNSEGVLATAIHSDHAIYQAAIPQNVKDKVKDSLRKK